MRRIWHLHGSINRVDTLILTSDQYLKLYPDGSAKRTDYQNAFNQFQQLLATRAFLFLGFSLAEPVLRRKLNDVLEMTARAAPLKYLLLRAGEADGAAQKAFLDNYNVQVIEFENFGAPMIEAIDAIGREAWADSLVVRGVGLTSEMETLVESLLQQLVGLVMPPQAVARIYNAVKPDAWFPLLTSGDGIALLREATVLLGGAVTPGRDALPPLLDFVDRLAAEATEPWLTRLPDLARRRGGADSVATRVNAPGSGDSSPRRGPQPCRIGCTCSSGFNRLPRALASGWYTPGCTRRARPRGAVWRRGEGIQRGQLGGSCPRSDGRARGAQRRSRPHEHRVHRAEPAGL